MATPVPGPWQYKARTTPEFHASTMELDFIAEWHRRYDDGHTEAVTFAHQSSPSHVLCGCQRMDKAAALCDHSSILLSKALDAQLIREIIEAEEPVDVMLPLFPSPSGEFKHPVRIEPIRMPSGLLYGKVLVTVPGTSIAKMLQDSYASAGDAVHPLGYVSPRDGREAMRAMLSAWVQAQTAAHDPSVTIECESYYHPSTVIVNTSDPKELSSLFLTGNCLVCATAEANIPDDVPVF